MKRIAVVLLLVLAPAAFAGIEKFATQGESGIQLMWWPKVATPKGWHHDEGSSNYFSFNAIAPDGSTFSKADTVLYAKASFKPRMPEIKNLAAFISNDISAQKASEPGVSITRETPIRIKGGLEFTVVRFEPGKRGSPIWERVAYTEDGEFFLTFVVSSHSQKGLESSDNAFRALLAGYTPGP